jgi:hypothetical protein
LSWKLKKIEMRYGVNVYSKTMFSATLSRAFTDSMADFSSKILNDAVERLASKYGFDGDEAKAFLMAGGVVQVKMPTLEKSKLPWCGHVDPECCKAIQKNGGLFTQCTNSPLDSGWCKKCAKDVEKNGTPSNGDVEARLTADIMTYKVGKTEVKPYIEYMMKNGITREQVEEAAAEYGLTVDPRQFEKKKRGRKNTTPRTMAPAPIAAEEPEEAEPEPEEAEPEPEEEEEEEELKEEVVVDLGALHKERLARAEKTAKEAKEKEKAEEKELVVDDKPLTLAEIKTMSKDKADAACLRHGISIEGKTIVELKKELKAMVK